MALLFLSRLQGSTITILMDDHKENFKKFFRRFLPIDDSSFEEILTSFELKVYAKGAHFGKKGQLISKMGFLSQGIARSYYLNEKGEEISRRIAMEPSMITAYDSFINQIPSRENIQFLEESYVWEISRAKDKELIDKNQAYSNWRRIGIDHEFISVLRYLERFIDANAESRYKMIMLHTPHMIERVPLQYIASLIGVTPTQLSRIRNKIR
ncbi:MAG: hypothetical protein AAFR66_09600 [Bacteroidota bacterium]